MTFYDEVPILAARHALHHYYAAPRGRMSSSSGGYDGDDKEYYPEPILPDATHLKNTLSALDRTRAELEQLREHIRNNHASIVCLAADHHAEENDGNDVVSMLTCLKDMALAI